MPKPWAAKCWPGLTVRAATAALIASVMGLGLANPARAQVAELQPSDALICLQHIKGQGQQPHYPELEFNANQGARVLVEMEFTTPDRSPKVSVLQQTAGQAFVDAVLEHVRGLRVPCLAVTGGSVRIKQDFDFAADRRQVHWTSPEDSDVVQRGDLWRCAKHPSGESGPEYPYWARRQELQGRVLARLRFSDGTSAPTVEVFSRPYASGLADEISAWAKDIRLPCHSGAPLNISVIYQFLMEGDRYGFKEITFREFLAGVKGIHQQVLQLDTTTMGCPFDVRLNYRQPLLPNQVGEVGTKHPTRRPLLEWLAKSELNLSRNAANSTFAADAKLTVPCMKIDLNPQEKKS